jgi:hypothetical protein
MINKLEYFLNIIHYCIYKLDYKLHLFSNKINPFLLLGKIPAIKRKFEERGTTQLEIANKIWMDKQNGFGIMISGGGIVILVFLVILSSYDILNAFLDYPIKIVIYPFIINMLLAYGICHFTVFRNNNYLNYFKKFDKMDKDKKRNYGILSFVYIILTFSYFVYSFKFLPLE